MDRNVRSRPIAPQPSLVFVTPRSRVDSDVDAEGEAALTAIGAPPPSLLALSRQREAGANQARRASRWRSLVWFLLGLAVGAGSVWVAKGNVWQDAYRARMWVESSLRSIRARVAGEDASPARAPVHHPPGAR